MRFVLASASGPTVAHAATSYDQAFVDAFAKSWVPDRRGCDTTRQSMLASGLSDLERGDPPCPMPRTGDTYLSFIAEGSPMAKLAGFGGIALNFSTSVPHPGEEVPETYC